METRAYRGAILLVSMHELKAWETERWPRLAVNEP